MSANIRHPPAIHVNLTNSSAKLVPSAATTTTAPVAVSSRAIASSKQSAKVSSAPTLNTAVSAFTASGGAAPTPTGAVSRESSLLQQNDTSSAVKTATAIATTAAAAPSDSAQPSLSPPREGESNSSVYERFLKRIDTMERDDRRKRNELRQEIKNKQNRLEQATAQFNSEYDRVHDENTRLKEQVAEMQRKNRLLSSRLVHISKGRQEEEARTLEEMSDHVAGSQGMVSALLDSLGPMFKGGDLRSGEASTIGKQKHPGGLLQDADDGLGSAYATFLSSTTAMGTGNDQHQLPGKPQGAIEVELLGACHQLASNAKFTLQSNQTKKLELKNELVGVLTSVKVCLSALEKAATMLHRQENSFNELKPLWEQHHQQAAPSAFSPFAASGSRVKFSEANPISPLPVPSAEVATPSRGLSAGTTAEISISGTPEPAAAGITPTREAIQAEGDEEEGEEGEYGVEGEEGEEEGEHVVLGQDGGRTEPSATGTTVLAPIDTYAPMDSGFFTEVREGGLLGPFSPSLPLKSFSPLEISQNQPVLDPTPAPTAAGPRPPHPKSGHPSMSEHLDTTQSIVSLVFETLSKVIGALRDLGESTLAEGQIITATNDEVQSFVETVRQEVSEVKRDATQLKTLHDNALSLFTQRLSREIQGFKFREDELLMRLSSAEGEYTRLLLKREGGGGHGVQGEEDIEMLASQYLSLTNPIAAARHSHGRRRPSAAETTTSVVGDHHHQYHQGNYNASQNTTGVQQQHDAASSIGGDAQPNSTSHFPRQRSVSSNAAMMSPSF